MDCVPPTTPDVAESKEFGKHRAGMLESMKSYSLCDGKYGNRQVGVPESREIVEPVPESRKVSKLLPAPLFFVKTVGLVI